MREGRIMGELAKSEYSEEDILRLEIGAFENAEPGLPIIR
jgi:hypothetical protein